MELSVSTGAGGFGGELSLIIGCMDVICILNCLQYCLLNYFKDFDVFSNVPTSAQIPYGSAAGGDWHWAV